MFKQQYFLIFFLLSIFLINTFSNKILAQNNSIKQIDSLYLYHPFKEKVQKIKKSFAKTFVNFVGNDLSLYGALIFSKQTLNDNGITAPINYVYNTVNNNTYNPGYSGGFRIDGIYKEKHPYSMSFAINSVTPGNHYKNQYSLSPFIEDFTHFKADKHFTTLNIAMHYKKLLPINDMNKYKFYAVFGPSFDYKISSFSNENLINGAGNRAIINGDFGAEFDNKGYYILYAHYKIGTNLFHTAVPTQLNRFEIGMSIKAKDLF